MVSLWYDTYQAICQFENAVMRQTLREALGIGHWALPACAETLGVTAGAPQRMARLPTLPHYRIDKLTNCLSAFVVHHITQRSAGTNLHLLHDLQRSSCLGIDPGFAARIKYKRESAYAFAGMNAQRWFPDDSYLSVRVLHGNLFHNIMLLAISY
jgi:hypothetical protein